MMMGITASNHGDKYADQDCGCLNCQDGSADLDQKAKSDNHCHNVSDYGDDHHV